MLQLRDYSKQYQNRPILSSDALEIPPGVHWLKGDNGSGKSTLFKSLAGIIPFQGEITLQGVDLKKNPKAYRKMVTYSEAEPLFPEFLTARDVVEFVGKARNSAPHEQLHFCERLGITSFFNQSCGTFSSGMLKRLSLVIAFLGDPKLIILDEPQVTLDQSARNMLINLILEKTQDPTLTILLSSHQSIDHGALTFTSTFHIREQMLHCL